MRDVLSDEAVCQDLKLHGIGGALHYLCYPLLYFAPLFQGGNAVHELPALPGDASGCPEPSDRSVLWPAQLY